MNKFINSEVLAKSMITRAVGERGQIVLPKKERDRLGLHKGTSVVFVSQSEGVLIKPEVDPQAWLEEFLDVPRTKKALTPKQMKKAILEAR